MTMSGTTDDAPLMERYEMLKTLCRQQIMMNETLKSEVSRLNNVLLKVSRERNLLLEEILETRFAQDDTAGLNYQDKPRKLVKTEDVRHHCQKGDESSSAKKQKLSNCADDLEDYFNHSTLENSAPTVCDHDRVGTFQSQPLFSKQCSNLASVTTSSEKSLRHQLSQVRSSPERFVSTSHTDHLGTSTNTTECRSTSPIVTGNSSLNQPFPQRTTRIASLVTNSSVNTSSSGTFVPFNSPLNSQATKYMSISNRAVKLISSASITSNSGTQMSHTSSILKSVPTSFSSTLRLSGASVGQRLMIQPNNCNVRSILIPRVQNNANDSSHDLAYAER